MEKLNAQQIIEVLKEKFDGERSYEEYQYQMAMGDYDEEEIGLGKIEEVFDENWGDGNEWVKVFHFVDHNVYLKVEGTYSSHDSSYFDDEAFEVFPHKILRMEYNKQPQTFEQLEAEKLKFN